MIDMYYDDLVLVNKTIRGAGKGKSEHSRSAESLAKNSQRRDSERFISGDCLRLCRGCSVTFNSNCYENAHNLK